MMVYLIIRLWHYGSRILPMVFLQLHGKVSRLMWGKISRSVSYHFYY